MADEKNQQDVSQMENEENTEVEEEAADKNPENELEILKNKLSESEDRLMRLAAEYDNYKKRTQKEKEARYADALVDVVAAILPVGDNLERAIAVEAVSDDAKKIQEGVVMVYKQYEDALSKLGVSVIQTEGAEFDPNMHNAVMHIEDENLGENVIAEEFMKGYIYKDNRVVRHSMVKVAN